LIVAEENLFSRAKNHHPRAQSLKGEITNTLLSFIRQPIISMVRC